MSNPKTSSALFSSIEVAPALARLCDARTHEIEWEIKKTHLRPGTDLSVLYQVRLPSGRDENVVLTTAVISAGTVVEVGETRVTGWRHPDDPRLPGLRRACDPAIVARWFGWPHVSLNMRSYRPMRRAVLEATYNGRTHFIKVVPPTKAGALKRRHQLLAGVGPAFLGDPAPGVILLEQSEGSPMANSLANYSSNPAGVPDSSSLLSLLARLPQAALELDHHSAWCDRLDFYTSGAIEQFPELRPRISAMSSELAQLFQQSDRGPVVPTHGDFYEANIFVTGGEARQLIDIDSVGPGFLVDDLACLLGHVAVLPDLSPRHYCGVELISEAWLGGFDKACDPVALRARTAGVILSLVIGAPLHQAVARVAQAEKWIAKAS